MDRGVESKFVLLMQLAIADNHKIDDYHNKLVYSTKFIKSTKSISKECEDDHPWNK